MGTIRFDPPPPIEPAGPEGFHEGLDPTRSLSLPTELFAKGNAPVVHYDQPKALTQELYIKIQAHILAGIFHDGK